MLFYLVKKWIPNEIAKSDNVADSKIIEEFKLNVNEIALLPFLNLVTQIVYPGSYSYPNLAEIIN